MFEDVSTIAEWNSDFDIFTGTYISHHKRVFTISIRSVSNQRLQATRTSYDTEFD